MAVCPLATGPKRAHHVIVSFGRHRVAVVMTVATELLLGAGLGLSTAALGDPLESIAVFVYLSALPLVGGLLAARRPSNPVGWILVAAALSLGVTVFATGWVDYVVEHPQALPVRDLMTWLQWPGFLAFLLPVSLLPLVFPNGELLSPRWRAVAGTAVCGLVATGIGLALRPGALDEERPELVNPYGLEGAKGLVDTILGVGLVLVSVAAAAGGVSLVLRYRRAGTIERVQIRLVAIAAVLLVVLVLVVNLLPGAHDGGSAPRVIADAVMFIGLPVAVAVAVLRHHLYEIDRLIRRSLVYGALWTLIAAVYVAVAAALGIAAGAQFSVPVAVAITIAVTLLVQPARRKLERVADRLVFGARLSGVEVLARFGTTLRESFDLDQIAPRLAATVRAGLGLDWARVSLYLPAADGMHVEPIGVDGAVLDSPLDPAVTVELVHVGEPVGVIECGPKPEGEISAADLGVLQTLADQAALAVRNARLAAELAARLDEIARQASMLEASRTRIVQAQDVERRRIERNLHDGAQQEIATLMTKLALARSRLHSDADRADATLAELQHDSRQLLVGLRELAQGIHPSVLTDRGLVDAIEARLRRLPHDAALHAPQDLCSRRFADAVEGAAYFVVSEALANIVKHAQATRAEVNVSVDGGHLLVEIVDDGVGFLPDKPPGGGLAGLADRVEAVGGTFTVTSSPGGGAVVRAVFPARAREAADA